jgi:hypothetical protein
MLYSLADSVSLEWINFPQENYMCGSCNCICIVFIVGSVSFIISVCCVLFERGVFFCVMCVILVLCLIVAPLPPGQTHLQLE